MTAKAENRTKCISAVSTLRQLWREYNLKQPTHLQVLKKQNKNKTVAENAKMQESVF